MNPNDRNLKITEILSAQLKRVNDTPTNSSNKDISEILNSVFSTTVWGYREIILVIAIAKIIDPTYRPSTEFYKCNPRAIYEGPIRSFLLKNHIPHRKSGPLNVAKATSGINNQWAAQRRPIDVAQYVVKIVDYIEKSSSKELNDLILDVLTRFIKEAKRVSQLTVKTPPNADPEGLSTLLINLIQNVADSGNTPQRIVGTLLETYHEDLQTGIKVVGHEDRASVTSTTSKKPGDISEEQTDGSTITVFEVTVKPFSNSRIDESYQTLKSYEQISSIPISEVVVICTYKDLPESIKLSKNRLLYLGKVEYQDVTYHFLDIYTWIIAQISRMSIDARLAFHEKMTKYIDEPNTAEKVKLFWNKLHSSSQ